MPAPDLLTLIRRACEGTAAEGLAPYVNPINRVPACVISCPHHSRGYCAVDGIAVGGACDPAVEALARLAVEGAAEVDRLTAELAAATAFTVSGDWQPNPSPAAVDGGELVWVPGLDACVWCLSPYGNPNPKACLYDATDDEARVWEGDRDVKTVDTGSTREGCLWIADRARADGYRVPPHPLGWDVGVEP